MTEQDLPYAMHFVERGGVLLKPQAHCIAERANMGVSTICAEEGITVATLNLAHGRATHAHQIFLEVKRIEANLLEIANFLSRESLDVVALQEADAPSFWSGEFDHVEYVARNGGFAQSLFGSHMNRFRLCYGTALLSAGKFTFGSSTFFDAYQRPLPKKGFVLGRVALSGASYDSLWVASVHLDFLQSRIRARQVEELVASLGICHGPLVVMGDFNCELESKDSAIQRVCKGLSLSPYRLDASTFPRLQKCWDWILISEHFHFESYRAVPVALSDHYPVIAKLGWSK